MVVSNQEFRTWRQIFGRFLSIALIYKRRRSENHLLLGPKLHNGKQPFYFSGPKGRVFCGHPRFTGAFAILRRGHTGSGRRF
eukprot:s4619_g5.t1